MCLLLSKCTLFKSRKFFLSSKRIRSIRIAHKWTVFFEKTALSLFRTYLNDTLKTWTTTGYKLLITPKPLVHWNPCFPLTTATFSINPLQQLKDRSINYHDVKINNTAIDISAINIRKHSLMLTLLSELKKGVCNFVKISQRESEWLIKKVSEQLVF